jgi:DNA repair exonuclease SbcCD ATPase subunit
MMKLRLLTSLSMTLALLAGCQAARTAYYDAWEEVGYAKRERLVDNVKAARAEQAEAKTQFANALEEFRSVVNFDGGSLEKAYNRLNASYERCQSQADDVNGKISKVKNVAASLFSEWQGEIKQIKDDESLQDQSQRLYDQTKGNYNEMISRMDTAAAAMTPVLNKFRNRVIFVKGNLNAQAIASLRGTEVELGTDIDKLIREMEASIAEADEFIAQIGAK